MLLFRVSDENLRRGGDQILMMSVFHHRDERYLAIGQTNWVCLLPAGALKPQPRCSADKRHGKEK